MIAVRRRIRLAAPLVVAAASLAVVAAGCGGSSAPSAQEQWANDVCTEVANWQTQITQLGSEAKDDIASPDLGLVETLKAEAQKAVTVTKQLATNLKALPPAPGANGQTAKQLLDAFGADVSQTVDELQADLNKLTAGSSTSDAVQTLTGAAASVAAVVAKGKSTLESIQETAGDLKQGFQDAEACKDLKENAS